MLDWRPGKANEWRQSIFAFEWNLLSDRKFTITYRKNKQLRHFLAGGDVPIPAPMKYALKVVQRLPGIVKASLQNAKKTISRRTDKSDAELTIQVLGQPITFTETRNVQSMGPGKFIHVCTNGVNKELMLCCRVDTMWLCATREAFLCGPNAILQNVEEIILDDATALREDSELEAFAKASLTNQERMNAILAVSIVRAEIMRIERGSGESFISEDCIKKNFISSPWFWNTCEQRCDSMFIWVLWGVEASSALAHDLSKCGYFRISTAYVVSCHRADKVLLQGRFEIPHVLKDITSRGLQKVDNCHELKDSISQAYKRRRIADHGIDGTSTDHEHDKEKASTAEEPPYCFGDVAGDGERGLFQRMRAYSSKFKRPEISKSPAQLEYEAAVIRELNRMNGMNAASTGIDAVNVPLVSTASEEHIDNITLHESSVADAPADIRLRAKRGDPTRERN